jgi:hypothetical protein
MLVGMESMQGSIVQMYDYTVVEDTTYETNLVCSNLKVFDMGNDFVSPFRALVSRQTSGFVVGQAWALLVSIIPGDMCCEILRSLAYERLRGAVSLFSKTQETLSPCSDLTSSN